MTSTFMTKHLSSEQSLISTSAVRSIIAFATILFAKDCCESSHVPVHDKKERFSGQVSIP